MNIIEHSAISHLLTRNAARSIAARNVTPVLYIDNTFLLHSVEPVVKDETRARVF